MTDRELIKKTASVWTDGGGDVQGFVMCYNRLYEAIMHEIEERENEASARNEDGYRKFSA